MVSLLSQSIVVGDALNLDDEMNIAGDGDAYAQSTIATVGDVTFLNDGNYQTVWSAQTSMAYAGIKLHNKYSIDKVRVVFKNYDESYENQLSFKFSYYDSITNQFVDLYSGTNYDENNDTTTVGHKYYSEYVLPEAIVTNEIKVTITSNNSQDMAIIAEIEAFGQEYDESLSPTNLALRKKITASNTDYERNPERIVDGNKGNYWDGGKYGDNGQYFIIDLGEECVIEEMKATPVLEKNRYYLYYIEVSLDGKNWQKVADRNETYGTVDAFEDETYTFDSLNTRYIKVTMTYNNANQSVHMAEFEVWGFVASDEENVALHKNVSATNSDNGTVPDVITDGSTTGEFWDGGAASEESPQSFIIDLGSGYFINKMKAYPYVDGIRYYEYNIEVSLDGAKWQEVAKRTAEDGLAYAGETFVLDQPVNARFVRVNMTYNSKVIVEPTNKSVHMYEFEVYGKIDPDYQAPIGDPSDPENIAFSKPVTSHLNTKAINNINDGFDVTYCTGAFAPAYFDIDLLENYDLSEIIIKVPVKEGRYYYFSIYGSVDGSNYDRLYKERSKDTADNDGYKIDLTNLENSTYRIVRVYLEYVSDTSTSLLSEVRIHGKATNENKEVLRTGTIDEILGIEPYDKTSYATEITEAETIENVYGIIDRNLGEKYRDWFTFKLAKNPKQEYAEYDYYTVSNANDKILITGNDGISLATGLNYYLKNYCKVNISEQANQTKMPDKLIKVDKTIYQYTPYEIRYGFNYCTLNYTFSYADAKMFQKEYDWLALNGVNVVLDLAGQEAVWIKFLMNFGYDFDSAKDWLAGPTYYAWQFMDNMEVIGGPVSDEWVKGRLEMARENQRWKNSLGMQTVLQGYAGMVPNNFTDYQDVEILEQGNWCGVPRPDMIRTDGELYDQYAKLFYEAQEWAFGKTSNYYAVDPFHEGGKRPSDLTDDVISREVLNSLLEYDQEAVWMVQAWWSNPTNDLLKGMGDDREDHVIILDLNGLNDAYDSYWDKTEYNGTVLESDEFNSTSWVWCMLENYGGNPSMDGRPKEIINRINKASTQAEHMKGIGFISEATYDNPMIYELLLDMAWQQDTIDLDDWLDEYVLRRYGDYSESAREAWDILLKTVYSRSGKTTDVIARSDPSLVQYGLPYTASELEEALELLYKDYDKLSASEAYRYDLTEIMRQVVNNYAVVRLGDLKTAYDAKEIDNFKSLKEQYLNAIDLLNEVCGTQQDLLIGEWVGRAVDWAKDTNSDDFAYDSMIINAKTLITVWAPSTTLGTYAYRNYEGMINDIYKVIWQAYLDQSEEILEFGSAKTNLVNYHDLCMNWIYEDWDLQNYQRYADNSPENVKTVVERVINECSTYVEVPENVGNIALEKEVFANQERPDSPGAPGGGYATNVNDGIVDTYWDGIAWNGEVTPYIIIDLGKDYLIDRMNVVNYYDGKRYYDYDLYVSKDNETWQKVANRKETYGEAPSLVTGDTYEFSADQITARYIKLVGLYNSANEGFHVKELRAYGNEITDKTALKIALDLANAITDEDLENVVKAVADEFKAARDEANAIYNDLTASQEEVNNAFDRLASAMHMLDFVKGDKTALKAFIDKVSGLEADKYTEATWTPFNDALVTANNVYNDENAMQEEVDATYKELVTAFLNLRLIPDKSLLEDLINKAEGLNLASYSKATVQVVNDALANAKNVLANENATQKDVDNAKATLEKAINSLEANVNTPADNTVSTPVNNGDTTVSVKTGDESSVGVFVTISLLTVAGYIVLTRKED